MSTNRFIALCLCLLATAPHRAFAKTTLESGPARVSVLELYSSEGCSSCPPAETWFSSLIGSAQLWKGFVPVCFHVDYWDYLGWKDILGARAFSTRQQSKGAESVYTPGFFLNNREWRGWFDGRTDLPGPGENAGRLRAESDDGTTVMVTYEPPAKSGTWEAEAALVGMEIVSDIKAGENRGRKLRHDFAVLSFGSAPLVLRDGKWSAAISLPASRLNAPRTALAVWVKKPGGAPAQAVGGWIRK